MKKISKIFGVITLMVVIGLSMTACPEEEEEEPATITVTNDSALKFDTRVIGVKVELVKDGAVVKTETNVQSTVKLTNTNTDAELTGDDLAAARKKSEAKFAGVEPGDYQIWITDARREGETATGANPYKSKTFTFGDGQTVTLSYDGNSVVVK
jgi:hypothetical protein